VGHALLQRLEQDGLIPGDEGVSLAEQALEELLAPRVQRLGVTFVGLAVRAAW
jgi:hypothetical protein